MLPKYRNVLTKEVTDKRDQGLVLIRIYVQWFEKTIFGENSDLLANLYKYRYAPLFRHLNLVNSLDPKFFTIHRKRIADLRYQKN